MPQKKEETPDSAPAAEPAPKCGIVMPISTLDGCGEQHWSDVKEIIIEAVEAAGFTADLVSNADEVGIIQKRIIQNLYENPVVVCDVSGKNANVMFELGMRLAFDKPTVIIKDDKTSYSFDTSPIEHLEYPRDLRFRKIVDFKASLAEKVKATHERGKSDKDYSPFLKHFGTFTVARLETKVVGTEEFILQELAELRKLILTRVQPAVSSSNIEGLTNLARKARLTLRMVALDFVRSGITDGPALRDRLFDWAQANLRDALDALGREGTEEAVSLAITYAIQAVSREARSPS